MNQPLRTGDCGKVTALKKGLLLSRITHPLNTGYMLLGFMFLKILKIIMECLFLGLALMEMQLHTVYGRVMGLKMELC